MMHLHIIGCILVDLSAYSIWVYSISCASIFIVFNLFWLFWVSLIIGLFISSLTCSPTDLLMKSIELCICVKNHSLPIWTPWHNRKSLCKCPFGVTWFPRTSSYFTRFDVHCSYRCIAVAPLSIVIRTDIDLEQFVRVWGWCHFDG